MKGFTPWPPEFAAKYRAEKYWLDKTISEVMDESFDRYADNTILIDDAGGRLSYGRMQALVNRLALHLNARGLKLYDRVIMQLPNLPELLISYLAVLKAGGIPIMALPPHREAEIGFFAGLAEAKGLIIPADYRRHDYQAMAVGVAAENPGLDLILVQGGKPEEGFLSLDELLDDPVEERVSPDILPRPDPDEPAVLQLSGGTTGVPKLIPRTHNDYVYNYLCNAEVCRLSERAVLLLAIPQEHNFALACPGFKGLASRGGSEVLTGNTSPRRAMELIQEHRVTHWIAVPAMIISLLNDPERKDYDLSSLEVILTGGSKLNPEVARRIGPELGCRVQQVLGMAEGPLYWTRLDDPEEVIINTQGRPQSPGDEFRIVDLGTGQDAAPGGVGELWCRGPHTIRGYFRADEYNAGAFSPDGYYKSGDLVRLHPSGNIVVEGRVKDCINRGGEKISAEEVENHILAHPAVDNCAYVAMPDPVLGERPCACLMLKEGQSLTLDGLNGFLVSERRIAKFKLPERLEVLRALPLTNVGKVDKKALRKLIEQKLAAEGRSA